MIVNDLFDGNLKRNVKEINASDDNGIDVIRTEVKSFMRSMGGFNKVDYRVLVLEESDNITGKAQQALRRPLEKYYANCRVIMTGNYKQNIIPPVLSRFTPYDFRDITADEMFPRLKYICEKESIDIGDDVLMRVATLSNGDVRAAINDYLQRFLKVDKRITFKMVEGVRIDDGIVSRIVLDSMNKNFLVGKKRFYDALKSGIELRQLLIKVNQYVLDKPNFPIDMKGEIAKVCLKSDKYIINGASSDLVITGLVRRIQEISEQFKPK